MGGADRTLTSAKRTATNSWPPASHPPNSLAAVFWAVSEVSRGELVRTVVKLDGRYYPPRSPEPPAG